MRRSLASTTLPRLAAIGILAAMAGWLATASLQQDFAAYYTAGAAAARGLDPYVNYLPRLDATPAAIPAAPWDGISVYRHSRFLYPPVVAHAFRPLAALPFAWAKAIFTAASVVALLLGMGLVTRTGRPDAKSSGLTPLSWAVWPPVFLTLERGQIELLLLLGLAAAWHWRDRPLVAGPLLATAVMGKLLILGVLPLLLCARHFRLAAATLGALGLLAVATVAISGPALCDKYVREVLPRAASYGEGGPEDLLLTATETARVGDDLEAGVARIDGVGRAYPQEIGTFRRNASLPRLLAESLGSRAATPLAGITFLILGAALAAGARRSPTDATWYWGALLAAVVAAPVSWAMGLVWVLPLFHLASQGRLAPPAPPDGRRGEGSVPADERLTRRWLPALLIITFAAGLLGPVLSVAWVLAALAAVAAAVVSSIRSRAAA